MVRVLVPINRYMYNNGCKCNTNSCKGKHHPSIKVHVMVQLNYGQPIATSRTVHVLRYIPYTSGAPSARATTLTKSE